MENQDKEESKIKKENTPPVPNHWEPVPGQALVAEEIARRIEAEEKERELRKNKNKE